MVKHFLVLVVAALLGFSSIFLLPNAPQSQPIGVVFHLPEFVGDWYGEDQAITDREITVLGPGTEFARKVYSNGRGDSVFVSIVLSGQDMNTSIHRPERCLPAQGWTLVDSQRKSVKVEQGNLQELQLTRLHSVREIAAKSGPATRVFNVNYYWFAGQDNLTASHVERSWLDIRDRVLKGYNQRWAYITVASNVTKGISAFGRSEKETDVFLENFIEDIAPKILLAAKSKNP